MEANRYKGNPPAVGAKDNGILGTAVLIATWYENKQ
jgi:hypothetical protein